MKVNIDLSKVNEKSIAALIETNNEQIKSSINTGSVYQVYETVQQILKTAEVNTPATDRLLRNIRQAKNATQAASIIYNSFLAGCGLSTKTN